MELTSFTTPYEYQQFVDFIYRVYRGNPCFKDTLTGIVRTFLHRTDTFTRQAHLRPLIVRSRGEIVAQCIFIATPQLPVLQIGFFEALPAQQDAVEMLLKEAASECRVLGLNKIVAGLNGHLSYGVGFLNDHHDSPISFDCLYSPAYYLAYFRRYASREMTLTTFAFEMAHVTLAPALARRAYQHFAFRPMDMHRFHEEILLFGALCNQCLADTYLYFTREPECLYELLKELRPFLRAEHLIFAYHDGVPVGFIFWHPDINMIVPGGRRVSFWEIGLRYLLHHRRISSIKINAIGVTPAYQHSAVVAGLIAETIRYAQSRYRAGETNFIWDSNTASIQLNRRIMDGEYRHYSVFEFTPGDFDDGSL